MKYSARVVALAAGCVFALGLVTPAGAIPIAVVGSVDNFLASTVMQGNGKATEEAWVSGILGFAVAINYQNDTTAGTGWDPVDGTSDHWAHALVTDPAHYVLKLGVGNSGADTHYLFENLADLSWAVIDLSVALAGQSALDFNFGRVSHIGELGGGSIDLSEPSALGLLIFGLALFGVLKCRGKRVI
jgi:hypothetical protein